MLDDEFKRDEANEEILGFSLSSAQFSSAVNIKQQEFLKSHRRRRIFFPSLKPLKNFFLSSHGFAKVYCIVVVVVVVIELLSESN